MFAKKVEKGKSAFAGTELLGKTLGVIGLGAIGGMVANAAISLGMNVLGYDVVVKDRVTDKEIKVEVELCDTDTAE